MAYETTPVKRDIVHWNTIQSGCLVDHLSVSAGPQYNIEQGRCPCEPGNERQLNQLVFSKVKFFSYNSPGRLHVSTVRNRPFPALRLLTCAPTLFA